MQSPKNEADIDDAELVRMVKSGDSGAFDMLVRRFQRPVYAAAFAVLSDREAAQDVLQDSMVAAYRQLGKLKDASKFGSWVCAIAANQAKRSYGRRTLLRSREVCHPVPGRIPTAPTHGRSLAEQVREALGVLSPPQAQVVTLFYMEGYSVTDCAEMLDVPEGTVKRRLHDARQRLKKELAHMLRQHMKEFALPEDYRVVIDKPSRTISTAPSLAWFHDRWVLVWQDGDVWEHPVDHTEGNGPFRFLLSESANGKDWTDPKLLDIQPQWQHLPRLCGLGAEFLMHTHHHHYGLKIHRSKDLCQWIECPLIHAFDVGRSDAFSTGTDLFVTYPIWRPHEMGDAVEVLRSSDVGSSWAWLNQPYPSSGNGITDAAGTVAGGRMVIAWRGHDYPLGCGNPNKVYVCWSEDNGQTWTEPVLVAPLSTSCGSFELQVLAMPDARLAIAQDRRSGYTSGAGEIWIAFSRDGGKTWDSKATFSAGQLTDPAVAFSPDGRLLLAGSSRTGDEARPWVVHSQMEC